MKVVSRNTSFCGLIALLSWASGNAAPTSDELMTAYPKLESNRTGNPYILCPFLRMLERSGRLDTVQKGDSNYTVDNNDLKAAAEDFGCDSLTACGPVIDLVSSGQRGNTGVWQWLSVLNPFDTPTVDLERLWDAPPVSHECGLTYEGGLGNMGVSEARLNSTMTKFALRMDANATLTLQDVVDVKLETCADEGINWTPAGEVEAHLLFAYLGGVERGYVDYYDVERFLQVDNTVPSTKAALEITVFYIGQVGVGV